MERGVRPTLSWRNPFMGCGRWEESRSGKEGEKGEKKEGGKKGKGEFAMKKRSISLASHTKFYKSFYLGDRCSSRNGSEEKWCGKKS